MHALPLILGALCVIAIAYRYYSAFIAAKVLALDDAQPTPAHRLNDGHNYVPTNKWVLFGHHFAAITGAGPLVGPVLAAQFGFLPGYLWILVGVVLGGAVHDCVVLSASMRMNGRSLAEIVRAEIGPRAGLVASIVILFIVTIAIAAMAKVVVTTLAESSWGTFTIAMTIPIALCMGVFMHRSHTGGVGVASAFGVVALLGVVYFGRDVAASGAARFFVFSEHQLTIGVAVYGFVASVLPVWLLLCPRDYLSSYMKLGTVAALVLGIIIVNPELKLPAVSQFTGGGPIVPGKLFPFVFITIACGAISGFHGLIGSGTTPKMIDRESHARMIGYGAMLLEALVGIVALIAAASLAQGDYFAINTPPDKFAGLGMPMEDLPRLAEAVGERLQGRTGGAVSLAVGMSKIFAALPSFETLISYWYHFAIMFEALFILTTVDSGTRVARFLVQEFLGRIDARFSRTDWMPGTIAATLLVTAAWSYLVWTGSIATLWPLLGISNQMLACIALCTVTTLLVNRGKARYAWVTLTPMLFVGTATETAAYQLVVNRFWPERNWLLALLTVGIMLAFLFVLGSALRLGRRVLARERTLA